MIHFGDIMKLNGAEMPPVDIITGGSPCQDLSVAGKRAGLAGERSGLFMEQMRIIKEMRRQYGKPRFMVWENVPGAFSSNKGEDFRAVLEETVHIVDKTAVIPGPPKGKWQPSGCIMGDGWSIAWRVHDAQFWGVLQRRKRISLVADFGGGCAPEILFERKSVSGDTEASGKEGQRIAGDLKESVGEAIGFNGWQSVTAKMPTLKEKMPPIEATMPPNVLVYGIGGYNSEGMRSDNPHSGIYEADTARTLDLNGGTPACNQGGMAVVCIEGNGSRPSHKGDGYAESEIMYTMNATERHAVCVENHPCDSRCKISEDGMVQTLSGRMGTGGNNVPMVMETEPLTASKASFFMKSHNDGKAETLVATDYKDPQIVTYGLDRAAFNQGARAKYDFSVDEEIVGAQTARGPGAVFHSIVRRLTPLECERLQGFPVVRKVRFTKMTKDEYIAWNINEGNIVIDTECGKVFATRGPGGIKLDEPRELTGTILNGYRVVSIRNGKTKMQCRVHRIVWIAVHGIIPDGYVIDHINNDKQDNRLCNLQLLTAAENSTKARVDGLYKIHDDAGQAKITDEVHDFIQYVYGNSDLSIRQLSEIFGISKSRVHQIIHDESWTDIGDWIDSKGKLHKGDADSPRYKALGNSIALPFWRWMAERMLRCLDVDVPTMGSLFDGIGGFPLVFAEHGCETVWTSEIEEFPIAVVKKHFSDSINL